MDLSEKGPATVNNSGAVAAQTPPTRTMNRMPTETAPTTRTLTRMPTEAVPTVQKTLPQINSMATNPFEKTPMTPEQVAEQLRGTPPGDGQATFEAMQSSLPEKTPMTPEQVAEQLRGTPPGEGQATFEAMSSEQGQTFTKDPTLSSGIQKTADGTSKLASDIPKPVQATQERLTSQGDKTITKAQTITSEAKKTLTSTALQPLQKVSERPPWARGPTGSVVTPKGWYYDLPGGGRFSVEFSDDWMTRKTTQMGTGDSDYTETVPVTGG